MTSARGSASSRCHFDLAGLKRKRAELDERMTVSDFWNNPERATATVEELKRLRGTIEPVESLEHSIDDAEIMLELAAEDESVAAEAATMVDAAFAAFDRLELKLMLSGLHDHRNAYVAIQAGAGGTESCDWAQMLLRMYLRWAEHSDFEAELVDEQKAEEAGIRSATILLKGEYAYGYLKGESGVHRLVRISPFDSQARRQTSFASVDVSPELDDAVAVEIRPEDLRVDTFRAGGAGGQHVNKTDSAVRFTHLPTGIVVACQSERSQHKNRDTAMKMLRAKLFAKAEAEREAELRGLAGEKTDIGWGHQIRSYVLQPYTMVKDVRSGVEKGNAQGVLDGDLDEFIEGYLRWMSSGKKKEK
jgi:peptide chain release factor 2